MIEVYHVGLHKGKPIGSLPCRTEDVPSFPQDYYHIATLDIPDSRIGDVFALTNNIDTLWTSNPEVVSYPSAGLRSTSINDVIKLSNGTLWRCMPTGWQEIKDGKWETVAETLKRRWDQQYFMARQILDAGFNVVTCGTCGDVMLYRMDEDTTEDIECPYCGFTGEPCDFPEFFHERAIEDFEGLTK